MLGKLGLARGARRLYSLRPLACSIRGFGDSGDSWDSWTRGFGDSGDSGDSGIRGFGDSGIGDSWTDGPGTLTKADCC
jgi:hypothetical protein